MLISIHNKREYACLCLESVSVLYRTLCVCVFSQAPPDWQEILAYFRGSELQNYFTKILEDDLKAIVKPQYVDQIPKTVKVKQRKRAVLF